MSTQYHSPAPVQRHALRLEPGLAEASVPAQLEPGCSCSDSLLDAADVARLLGVKVAWVYANTRAGEIPHVPLGRYKKYRREAVMQWVLGLERGR